MISVGPELTELLTAPLMLVIDIPADPSLARGQLITLEALAENTHHAYLALAAAVMDAPFGEYTPLSVTRAKL